MKRTVLFILCSAGLIALAMTRPGNNTNGPATRAELGEKLFFDPILSSDSTISCGSCHQPAFAFADTGAVSKGVGGRLGTRNTPSSMNMLVQQIFFWDGRSVSLEDQALKPISNPDEMNLPVDEAVRRLKNHPVYSNYFRRIFNADPD
jgi:cytochrome c peroxidase